MNEDVKQQWFAIVNPTSGNGRGAKDWPLIREMLHQAGITFEYQLTQKPYQGLELAGKALKEGYRKLLIVGGDGTMNEAVNAVHRTGNIENVTLGIIPIGTGNDWCRTMGIPHQYGKAVEILCSGKTFHQDIGYLTFSDGKPGRCFINIAGIGFDARVVQTVQKKRLKSGSVSSVSYLWYMLRQLIGTQSVDAELLLGEQTVSKPLFTLAAAICRYNGGGMKQAPDAIPDDGLLDITFVTSIAAIKVLLNLPKLYSGSFVKLKEVFQYRTPRIVVETAEPVPVETDGELAGQTPVQIHILPEKLRVIAPGPE